MSHKHEVPKGWTKGEPLEVTSLERKEWSAYGKEYVTHNPDRWCVGQCLSGLCPVGSIALDDVAYILFDSRTDLDAFLKWWNE